MAKTRSKKELIEKVVFENAFSSGLFVCSPEGQLLKMEIPFFRSQDCFHHLNNSTPEFFDENYEYADASGFIVGRLKEISDFLDHNNDPWFELRNAQYFCSINYFYNRLDYTISTKVYKTIERITSEFVGETLYTSEHVMRPFNRWAICVSEDSAKSLSFDKLKSKYTTCLHQEIEGKNSQTVYAERENIRNGPGRPPKLVEAARAFFRHFTMDNRPSWKEVLIILEDKEGIIVHARTLKRGIDKYLEDKTSAKSTDNTST